MNDDSIYSSCKAIMWPWLVIVGETSTLVKAQNAQEAAENMFRKSRFYNPQVAMVVPMFGDFCDKRRVFHYKPEIKTTAVPFNKK